MGVSMTETWSVFALWRASVGGEYSFCLLALCLHMSTCPSLLHKTLPRRHIRAPSDTFLRPHSQKYPLFTENHHLGKSATDGGIFRLQVPRSGYCAPWQTEGVRCHAIYPPQILNATIFTIFPTADLITVVFSFPMRGRQKHPFFSCHVLHQHLQAVSYSRCIHFTHITLIKIGHTWKK